MSDLSDAEITEALGVLETAKPSSKAAKEAIATIHSWYSIWSPSIADHSLDDFGKLAEQLEEKGVLDKFTESNGQARELLQAVSVYKRRKN